MLRRLAPLLLILLMPQPGWGQAGEPGASGPDLSETVKEIVAQTNAYRKREGRDTLKTNSKLTRAAESFAAILAQSDELSHTADGKQPAERVADARYDFCLVAENIAYEFSSAGFGTKELARRFFESWKASPGHRKNLLDPDLTEIGVGIARSEKTGRYYAVQDFGRPKADAIIFRVTNQTPNDVRYTVDDRSYPLEPQTTRTHEVCRPPKLHLGEPSPLGGESAAKPAAVRPRTGDVYAIQRDANGREILVKQDSAKDRSPR